MNFFTGLGNFSGGAASGLNLGSEIASRAQNIRVAQFALDQQKKQVAADAMAFANLGGGAGSAPQMAPPPAPMTQPMAPGQPSVPAQPGPTSQAPAIAPAPQAVLQPSQPVSQPPMSPPGGATAPSPQGGGAPSPQPQAAPAGIDPTDPMAGVKVVTQIAQEIKARNPGIDPQTLLLATQRVIDMSKGMAPALRTGATIVLQDMKDKAAGDRNAATNQSHEDIADKNIASRGALEDKRQAGANYRAQLSANAAMERVNVVQAELNKRFQGAQGNKAQQVAVKERIDAIKAQLTAASRKLASLKDATGQPLPETDPRVVAASKEVADATRKLDIIQTTLKVAPPAAGPAAASGGNGPPKVTTQAQFDALPKGATYVGEDGQTYRKP